MNPPTLDDIEQLSHPALILRYSRVLDLLATVWNSRRDLQDDCVRLTAELEDAERARDAARAELAALTAATVSRTVTAAADVMTRDGFLAAVGVTTSETDSQRPPRCRISSGPPRR